MPSFEQSVHPLVPRSVRIIISHLTGEDANRTGGWCCVGGFPAYGIAKPYRVAVTPPEDKSDRYSGLALEKLQRLATHPDHVSSWQSRDPGNDKWGGAVRAGNIILSFSGLPELADEAAMLHLAMVLNLMTIGEAVAIARLSDNQHFLRLGVRSFLSNHPSAR